MRAIIWTKQYHVTVGDKLFKLFVSSHNDRLYFAAILYYERTGAVNIVSGSSTDIEFKLHTTAAESEGKAMSQIQGWMKQEFGQYAMTEIK